jgi:hypothetical protein
MVWCVQALPVPMLLLCGLAMLAMGTGMADNPRAPLVQALALVNASALLVRLMLLVALRGSYATRGAPFWFSWLADIPAAWRLTQSTARVPRSWRGRNYVGLAVSDS